jgi:hypothetical protein
MNAQLKECIQKTKFAAFMHGYAELCEFLNTATWEEPFFDQDRIYIDQSTWLNTVWDQIGDLEESKFTDHSDYRDILRKIKQLENLQKLVVHQGRKCGMVFQRSYIGYARIQLKP